MRQAIKYLVKWPLRFLLRLLRDIDDLFSELAAKLFKTQYELSGSCKKRGICCQNIAVYLSPAFWKYPALKYLARRWYEFIYSFELKAERPDYDVLIFTCNYLQNDGKCSIYAQRPLICRKYPAPRYFGQPELLPGCGYQLELRKQKKRL